MRTNITYLSFNDKKIKNKKGQKLFSEKEGRKKKERKTDIKGVPQVTAAFLFVFLSLPYLKVNRH
jgi:hypothetical protein